MNPNDKIVERLADHMTLMAWQNAHRRAAMSKGLRPEVLKFNMNETSNLLRIMDIVGSGRYRPSRYREFYVYEPKKRLILALPYLDRIVHQWFVGEFIKPFYLPRFISDSYACIPGRGTHAAVDKTQYYMQIMQERYGHYYVLKMDISKFFYTIDKAILWRIISARIVDPPLAELAKVMVFDDNGHSGIPIGNYISQYFANIYLNELDWYCKRAMNIEFYVRYMDDFVMLAPSRLIARQWYDRIEQFVNKQLNLRLNPKSRYYPAKQGLDFVGYRIFSDRLKLRRRAIKKLHQIQRAHRLGVDDDARYLRRMAAWRGHAQRVMRQYPTNARLPQ